MKTHDATEQAYKNGYAKGFEDGKAKNAKTVCDICRYNPPSSLDGKPCTFCVAETRVGEKDD